MTYRPDLDALARALLADPLDPALPLEPDLRDAIRAGCQRRGSLVPLHINQAAAQGTLDITLLGERNLDGIYARAYRIAAPLPTDVCPLAYSAVVVLAGRQIVHFALNALATQGVHPLTRQLSEWNLASSVIAKLRWYGMLPDYTLDGAAAFTIADRRWEAIDATGRDQLVERLTRLARQFRLVTFAKSEPIPLRVHAVPVDGHDQPTVWSRTKPVFSGLA
jgi:hypothetical protein